MSVSLLLLVLIGLTAIGYLFGRSRASALSASVAGEGQVLHSLPSYYGSYVALWAGIPALALALVWLGAEPQLADRALEVNLPAASAELSESALRLQIQDIKNHISLSQIDGADVRPLSPELVPAAEAYEGLRQGSALARTVAVLALALIGLGIGYRRIHPELRARNQVERVVTVVMIVASTIAILTTVGIVLSLIFESALFFTKVPWYEFLFGLHWSPQTALRADQVGAEGAFGAVPLFVGTLVITVIAMTVAAPVGLFSAIYMSEYASPRVRAAAKPALEILAGVPTVVYGFFAALTVAPLFRGMGESIGLDVASESALAVGVVMGVMIIPFVSSLSDDVMNAVPQTLRDGAYALGATQSETVKQVILPAALPGIVGALLLAISRAIGETMIVVMAAGLSANLTVNPVQAVTTVTVQIVTLLVGDQEFDSAKTLSAFALGLVLFVVTLGLNVVALQVVRKYREKYD
ncbi:MAG: phosphate ABC transporter permease subunit PstC [Alphaproteobacteria bacterium]|nr:phosphate ABC transporter permease subunit PstC [Alphaproteobacteria bacterium]